MKFYGKVGYGLSGERQNGVWKDTITEREYYGDVVKIGRRLVSGEDLNADITTENSISIVADPFANEHFHAIKYVEWQGALWTVSTVDVQRPRLILRLGGVYDGPRPSAGSGGSTSGTPEPARRDTGR